MTTDASLNNIPQFLDQLRQSRFYGSLEIKLEAGSVVLIRKTETIKPGVNLQGQIHRDSRGKHEFNNN